MTKRVLFLLLIVLALPSVAGAQSGPTQADLLACVPKAGELPRFRGARPESLVLRDVDLLSQPTFTSDTRAMKLVTIPKGARVVVFDIDNVIKDRNSKWFRVLWACDSFAFAGWVPVSAVRLPPIRVNEKVAPPGCAIPLAIIDSIDGVWESTYRGKISAVIDLFRNPTGTFYPSAFLYMTRNGRELRDRDREFKTSGPFLLNGVVIQTEVQRGTEIGFTIVGGNREPVRLFATIYAVPQGCEWNE
ncbi:MAG: hypothetical protein NZ571_10315 [Anaerolineae bacterium]|nr:hypothetical protein [Anaerolineae bacterium]